MKISPFRADASTRGPNRHGGDRHAGSRDADFIHNLGVEAVIDYKGSNWEAKMAQVDVMIDTVGGETARGALAKVNFTGCVCDRIRGRFSAALDVRSQFFCGGNDHTIAGDNKLLDQRKFACAGGLCISFDRSPRRACHAGESAAQTGKDRARNWEGNGLSRSGSELRSVFTVRVRQFRNRHRAIGRRTQ